MIRYCTIPVVSPTLSGMESRYLMTVHLLAPILYQHAACFSSISTTSCAAAYDQMVRLLADAPQGSDACLFCEATENERDISHQCGKAAWNFSDKEEEAHVSLPAGSYRFSQFSDAPADGNHLAASLDWLLSLLELNEGSCVPFFIRLYKEQDKSMVVQFFAPIHTTA